MKGVGECRIRFLIHRCILQTLCLLQGKCRISQKTHLQNVLNVADYADYAEGHKEREQGGDNHSGVVGKPQQEACLDFESEERNVSGCGKN